jgi:hypothetical protein
VCAPFARLQADISAAAISDPKEQRLMKAIHAVYALLAALWATLITLHLSRPVHPRMMSLVAPDPQVWTRFSDAHRRAFWASANNL